MKPNDSTVKIIVGSEETNANLREPPYVVTTTLSKIDERTVVDSEVSLEGKFFLTRRIEGKLWWYHRHLSYTQCCVL